MASALPAGIDEDRVAAMSAALLSLGERAAQGLGRGELSQVYIEGEDGTVFLISADDEAVLVAVGAHIRLESAEEHGPMREAMTELLKIDTADEAFDTKLERLVEVVDRHANEQEQHLFPVAAQTLNDADLADLAKQMRGTMELLDGQGCPRYSLVQPTHPVPLKYAAPRFRPYELA